MLPVIQVGDVTVPFVTKHCFLGLILDGPYLTWKHHIEYLRTSCMKRLDIMKRVAGKSWGMGMDGLLLLYQSFVRSKLDYGCIIYGSASKTLLSKLDVVQCAVDCSSHNNSCI